MAQKVRRQKNRNKVKGVAVKKNKNPDAVQKVTRIYGGGVTVVTYKKKGKKNNDSGG